MLRQIKEANADMGGKLVAFYSIKARAPDYTCCICYICYICYTCYICYFLSIKAYPVLPPTPPPLHAPSSLPVPRFP